MKRFLVCVFAIVALGACASAESLIFDLGGGSVNFGGGVGNTWTFTLPVTTVHTGTGSPSGSCITCTLTFTTGTLGSYTQPSGGGVTTNIDSFGGGGSYSVTGTKIANGPTTIVGPGTYATNGTSGSTVVQVLVSGSPVSQTFSGHVFEPGSAGFVTVLTAFGLPHSAGFFPYSGPITFNFSSLTFTGTHGAFSGTVGGGGTLELDAAPETSSIILIGAGLSFIGLLWRRRQRA